VNGAETKLCDVRLSRPKLAAMVRVASLVGVIRLCSPRGFAASQDAQSVDPLKLFSQSVESLVQRISPSVVKIVVSSYGPLKDTGRNDTDVVIGRQRSRDRESSWIPIAT